MSDKKTKTDIEVGAENKEGNDKAPNDPAPITKAEQRRRNRAFRVSKTIFRAIDILYDQAQNTCPHISVKDAEKIECEKNVVYDEMLPDVCCMDIYRVKSDEPQPAVMLIHGGGFSAGDKKYRRGQSQFLAFNGVTVFCVNYGLAPEHVFPEPLRQLVNAANFIYSESERFGIDGDRIIVAGDSAGGYYASMLATFNCSERFREVFGTDIKFGFLGAVLNCGLYDMKTALETKYIFDVDDGVFLSFTGISKREFEDFRYKNTCMPLEYITSGFPPTFVIYSPRDLFCKGQGEVLVQKLISEGVYCEYYAARHMNSNHCFSLTWHGEDAVAANELLLSYIKRLSDNKIKF